jgi:hypothetical protein
MAAREFCSHFAATACLSCFTRLAHGSPRWPAADAVGAGQQLRSRLLPAMAIVAGAGEEIAEQHVALGVGGAPR